MSVSARSGIGTGKVEITCRGRARQGERVRVWPHWLVGYEHWRKGFQSEKKTTWESTATLDGERTSGGAWDSSLRCDYRSPRPAYIQVRTLLPQPLSLQAPVWMVSSLALIFTATASYCWDNIYFSCYNSCHILPVSYTHLTLPTIYSV